MKKQLIIKDDTRVFVDKKTQARTIALPFRLSDNSSAICMITRLKKEDWKPQEIKSITITFK